MLNALTNVRFDGNNGCNAMSANDPKRTFLVFGFFGNGAYYGPDLTKAWLDPAWAAWKGNTGGDTQEEAMVRFLMDPVRFRTWTRTMPNLHLSRDEAVAVVAYLKWLSAIDTNGFPANFGHVSVSR